MAWEGQLLTATVVASLDYSSKQFFATNWHGNLAGCNGAFFGVCQNKPKAGEHMTVGFAGISKAIAGAAITAGKPVAPSSTGYFAQVNSAVAVGRALTAASSGALFSLHIFGGVSVCQSEFA